MSREIGDKVNFLLAFKSPNNLIGATCDLKAGASNGVSVVELLIFQDENVRRCSSQVGNFVNMNIALFFRFLHRFWCYNLSFCILFF